MTELSTPCYQATAQIHSAPVLLYQTDCDEALTRVLSSCCQDLHLTCQEAGVLSEETDIHSLPMAKPALILLPVVEEDCLSIKWTQHLLNRTQAVAIGLVTRDLPSKAFLCLAYREGVDDILNLSDGPEMLTIQLRRLLGRLQGRISAMHDHLTCQQTVTDWQEQCEALHRDAARCKERLVALATCATQLATGERQLAVDPPVLMILAKSRQQAACAEQLAIDLGFQVTLAHSGQSALTAIQARAPHIVLLDSLLPDMDLADFVHRARRGSTQKSLTVIAWSSNPENEDRLMRPETGLDDFVLKTANGEGAPLLAAALLGGLR